MPKPVDFTGSSYFIKYSVIIVQSTSAGHSYVQNPVLSVNLAWLPEYDLVLLSLPMDICAVLDNIYFLFGRPLGFGQQAQNSESI